MEQALQNFISQKFFIKTSEDFELEEIIQYLENNGISVRLSSVHIDNRSEFPWIGYQNEGVHGYGYDPGENSDICKSCSYPEWLDMIGMLDSDSEFEESEYDISFMM